MGTAGYQTAVWEVTTDDNSWTTIRTYELDASGMGYTGILEVDARRTDAVDFYSTTARLLAWNEAGSLTVEYDTLTELGNTTLNVRGFVTGTTLEIQVQGRNAQDWSWDLLELYREVD